MTMRSIQAFALLALSGLAATTLGACISENNYAERYAETLCEKSKECANKNDIPFDKGDCIKSLEDIGEYIVDECDDYSGTLAHKCLKEAEDAGCNSTKVPDACKDFDDKCGFKDGQTGRSYGLTDYVEEQFQLSR